MPPINYASDYARELANAYPYVLNFGALYATPNNGRYRMGEDAKSIYIPRIRTSGRVDSNRDTIAMATRNYDNSWELKTLTHQRKWSTLIHPKDIDQTNMVASIGNITQEFNEQHKFPEMDAYLISRLYALWSTADATDSEDSAVTADTTQLTAANILSVFDTLMLNMNNALVPPNGRICYCTYEVEKLLHEAQGITRNLDATRKNQINRSVTGIEGVTIIGVPNVLMKTRYLFESDWAVDTANAQQINMFLVHPSAVITPVSYEFATIDSPSAVTEGKYIYFEESYEDVFILNKRKGALQFNVNP
jgi:hypothetical protein